MSSNEVSCRRTDLPGTLNKPDLVWRSVREEPFRIHGLYKPEIPGKFRRLPADVAEATSKDVAILSEYTTGGRVRFVTDSPYVAIHAEMTEVAHHEHMTDCGHCGLDMYVKRDGKYVFRGTFRPPVDMSEGYESVLSLPGGKWEVMVNFPLCNDVSCLLIGLKEGCTLEPAGDYRHTVPVVYYGSSITQGGCASRPGNCYESMISRMLDCDYITLGFSASAKGEPAICDYMATLDMSVFVCDYDHNAPNAEHLRATHEPLYRTIRKAHPDLPIIFITRPDVLWHDDVPARREAIRATYEKAVSEGDRNVAFIDGETLFEGFMAEDCTVDGVHPNDLGMLRMAEVISRELRRWL